jgi:hypothetical protein
MAEAKTKPEPMDVEAWIAGSPLDRQGEARRLLAIFGEVTGFEPQNWSGMAGFGRYDYTYDSGHSGSSFATGFTPRKAELSIYTLPGYSDFGHILADLGKHRMGKSCLYLKRLEGVNEDALRRLIRAGLDDLGKAWTIFPA